MESIEQRLAEVSNGFIRLEPTRELIVSIRSRYHYIVITLSSST